METSEHVQEATPSTSKADKPSKSSKKPGKGFHQRKFVRARVNNNKKDADADTQEYNRLVSSSKIIEFKTVVPVTAPLVKFKLTTENFRMFNDMFLRRVSARFRHVYDRWGGSTKFSMALNNIVSDFLIWRYCASRHAAVPILREVYDVHQSAISSLLNNGPMIPASYRAVLFLTGDFEYGQYRQRYCPILVGCEELSKLSHSNDANFRSLLGLRFMAKHAICLFNYGESIDWSLFNEADLAIALEAVGILSRYGSTTLHQDPANFPPQVRVVGPLPRAVLSFTRMRRSDAVMTMIEFNDVFGSRLVLNGLPIRKSDEIRPGSASQMAFYGDIFEDSTLLDHACAPLEMSSHDLIVGAAMFSPLDPTEHDYIAREQIRSVATSEDQDTIMYRVISEAE